MKKFLVTLVIFSIFFCAFSTQALEKYKSRVSVLIHAKALLTEEIKIDSTTIFGEMQNGFSVPSTFLGIQLKMLSWLVIEPKVGWNFTTDESFIGLILMPSYGKFWTWGTLDISLPSQNGYWFFQVEYNFDFWKNMLSAGLEGEGWGNYGDGKRWSNGGGPTIDLRFKYFELETSLQFRDYEQKTGTEFQVRLHLHLGE